MGMTERIKYFTKSPRNLLWAMTVRGYFRWVPDEVFLKYQYKHRTGLVLNLEQPATFNEKLQWLKLHDRKPEYSKMVDKYEVKKYVAERIGEQYIIPTLGVWDKFEDICFEELPEQFVLKCTHDSGSTLICYDKANFDKATAREFINKRLKMNYFDRAREWPYKNVQPRIIAEKFMSEDDVVSIVQQYRSLEKLMRNDAENTSELLSEDVTCTVAPYESNKSFSRLINTLSDSKIQSNSKLYRINDCWFGDVSLRPGTNMDSVQQLLEIFGIGKVMHLPKKKGWLISEVSGLLIWIHEKEPIVDYKILCFNGKVGCAQIHNGRNTSSGHTQDYYDKEWNRLPVTQGCPMAEEVSERPAQMDEIFALSEKLAEGICFLRVDWYIINGRVYFGELTFFDGSGVELFEPDDWNYRFGEMIAIHL